MKAIFLVCLCIVFAATLSNVECRKRKPTGPPRAPLRAGFRQGNGPCNCVDPYPSSTGSPLGTNGPMSPRPTGQHMGPMTGGHHGHMGPKHGGHHGPMTGGHHGHMGPKHGGHKGHHGHRPTGHHGHRHHSSRPRPTAEPIRRCYCGKQSERSSQIKFRMRKQWDKQLSVVTSTAFKRMSMYIVMKLKKVLKKAKRFTKMKYSEGSIVVHFGVVYDVAKDGSITEDPEKALRNAIQKGEMKDMDIYPDSLAVTQTYSGVQLDEWQASDHDCKHKCRRHHHHDHHDHVIRQTRTCTEIDASCDGIPLTRNATCEEACYKKSIGCWGGRRGKIIFIACIAVGVIFVIAIIAAFVTVKKSRKKKHMSPSKSTSSIKELAKHDELQFQSKC